MSFTKILKEKAEHYIWGDNCDGWIFVNTDNLSVKYESMPANTKEQKHYHTFARQFFYILKGKATFYIESEKIEVAEKEAISISPEKEHFISNESEDPIDFLVVSQPSTNNDRMNL